MIRQKEIVKTFVETPEGDKEPLVLAVKYPSNKLLDQANKVYARAWRVAVEEDGIPLKAKVDQIAEKNKLWDQEKTDRLNELAKSLAEKEAKLKRGGITKWGLGVGKVSAQSIAVEMLQDRAEQLDLINQQNRLLEFTAETYAETARVNFILTQVVVYNETGELYFKSEDDYTNRANEQAALDVFPVVMKVLYADNYGVFDNLPENKFLREHKMIDGEGRLLNKDGKFIDITGRLVNEKGQYINEKGDVVGFDGKPIEEVEFSPFLDDDGNPID